MPIQNISDTACWMAYARALESDRPDAIFRDRFSRALAGAAGERIARAIGDVELIARGIAVRTAVIDELILQEVSRCRIDLILDLAAGLDTRPWRLALPPALRWIDVDLPEILAHKARILGAERALCRYASIAADITDDGARARLLAHCGDAERVLVLTEGLLVYLSTAQVTALAEDLHGQPVIKWWLADITGPQALDMLRHVWGPLLRGATFQFGPADSVEFFRRLGWCETLFRSSLEEARRLRRATPGTFLSRLLVFFSTAARREQLRRLSGVALLERGAAPATDFLPGSAQSVRTRGTTQPQMG